MIIVWHYRDLRLEDNPALCHAAKSGKPVVPLYIHDVEAEVGWAIGAASQWWLHHSLSSLKKAYQGLGSDLVIRRGSARSVLSELLRSCKVDQVCWNRRYQPSVAKRDDHLADWLEGEGVKVSLLRGDYLVDPEEIRTVSGNPYVVFTPFARCVGRDACWDRPLSVPKIPSGDLAESLEVKELQLLPEIEWYAEMAAFWEPGRAGALHRLDEFVAYNLETYEKRRDLLAEQGTSLLSPHLAFGELSPREVWMACEKKQGAEPFLRQLLWREFANNFLHHSPYCVDTSWRREFNRYPWRKSVSALEAWRKGLTGYPIIDAAMRQLWRLGWMHNRARMIVGSFLVKDLHIHWLQGARWFWDTLVDADLANNSFGWQWVAGSGADAAPFFRVFNPVLQGKKFDPEGGYVRTYVPELSKLPKRWVHTPWEAPASVLDEAGIRLGEDYPEPIVDHAEARRKALEAYKMIKK